MQTLAVSRIGERIYFQVQLPYDTKRIIGLEYGATNQIGVPLPGPSFAFGPEGDTSLKVSRNKVIGKISLQNAGSEHLFYQGDLIENRNKHLGEGIISVLWQPSIWTHSRKREELQLNVESNTSFVEGFFQDSWGAGEYESLAYILHLYLWIEKCKPCQPILP